MIKKLLSYIAFFDIKRQVSTMFLKMSIYNISKGGAYEKQSIKYRKYI